MSDIENLTKRIVKFRDARDWSQFHNPKDVAISLSLEAAELLEHFQWKGTDEIEKHLKTNKNDVSDEIADLLYWVLLLSHDLKINIASALRTKIKKNEEKYPVEKAKGIHAKYNQL